MIRPSTQHLFFALEIAWLIFVACSIGAMTVVPDLGLEAARDAAFWGVLGLALVLLLHWLLASPRQKQLLLTAGAGASVALPLVSVYLVHLGSMAGTLLLAMLLLGKMVVRREPR